MSRYLTILEVSQKQAYIFANNKLADCVKRSDQIAAVTGAAYLERIAGAYFNENDNLVYSGGGHTVLEFGDREQAFNFCKIVTAHIHEQLPEIELFTATVPLDENDKVGSQKKLIQELEKKKAIRRSSFRQGTFGIEALDTNTKLPVYKSASKSEEYADESLDAMLLPDGYGIAKAFGNLGGSRDKSNYIAVVHIDGNGMGRRVSTFYDRNENCSWEEFKRREKEFSDTIDRQFKEAYAEMLQVVADRIESGKLGKLDLKTESGKVLMPVRRIITSGDDICFVSEGRIGIECAVEFIKALNDKVNSLDGGHYYASAGVAIVHQKYPFYRAYEIAEALCSNSKKFGAAVSLEDNGFSVCAVDWHLEKGELADSLKEIRENYIDGDGNCMTGRPYIVSAPEKIIRDNAKKNYEAFRRSMLLLQDPSLTGEVDDDGKPVTEIPRGKIKGLRDVLKKGRQATENYIRFNKIHDIVLKIEDDMEFDVIEIMDTYISLE